MVSITGWYPDPAGSADLRFWDGRAWTADTSPAAVPPELQPATEAAPVAGGVSTLQRAPAPYALSLPALVVQPPLARPWRQSLAGQVSIVLGVTAALIAGALYVLIPSHGRGVRVSAHTTIDMPDRVAGLRRIHDDQSAQLQRIMSSSSIPKPSLVGFYGTSSGELRSFMMIAKLPQSPELVSQNLDTALGTLKTSLGTNSLFQPAEAGPLGGQMRCATVVENANTATVCMFADSDVVGVTFSLGPDLPPGAMALTLRSAIEKRN